MPFRWYLPPIVELEKLHELSLMGNIDELEKQVVILTELDVKLKPFMTKIQAFLEGIKCVNL